MSWHSHIPVKIYNHISHNICTIFGITLKKHIIHNNISGITLFILFYFLFPPNNSFILCLNCINSLVKCRFSTSLQAKRLIVLSQLKTFIGGSQSIHIVATQISMVKMVLLLKICNALLNMVTTLFRSCD